MRLIYHAEADAELIEAIRFYRERDRVIAGRFRREIDEAVKAILEAPDRWRVIEREVRAHRLRSFPYRILYRVRGQTLEILVVEHASREPGYWQHRLKDEEPE
jgi:plasmid stabilization system protein ParE